MFKWVVSCIYFFLPAYFANMTPPLAKKAQIFKFLEKPVDFNRKINSKPVFGSHKTWRGLFLGVVVGTAVALLQKQFYGFGSIKQISFLNYKENAFFLGLLMSAGSVAGDLISAFFKRRLNLKPGAKFMPFDQINYVIGSFIFLTPFFKIDMLVWLTLLLLTFFLHIIVNRLGYHLKLHKAKW